MYIVLDTEFVWQRTYYANLGLIQAAPSSDFPAGRLPSSTPHILPYSTDDTKRSAAVLIDPLHCPPDIMADIVADSSVVKILHDAVQDLQHICRWCEALPVNVFDTRVAAGFAGLSSTISLRLLLSELLGVDLPKTETRTDWMKRPLSPEQLEYAADDVVYLGGVAEKLVERAKELGTYAWMMEEMRALDDPSKYQEDDIADSWKHVKIPVRAFSAPRQLIRLRELAAWRDGTARSKNLPRSWVVDDKVLVAAALNPPANSKDIPKKDLPRTYEAAFFEVLRNAEILPEENVPRLRDTATSNNRELATRMMEVAGEAAKKAHVDAALIGSRSDFTLYCQNPEDPKIRLNKGWRREVLGDSLLKLLPNVRLF